jgi:hypothetical protein
MCLVTWDGGQNTGSEAKNNYFRFILRRVHDGGTWGGTWGGVVTLATHPSNRFFLGVSKDLFLRAQRCRDTPFFDVNSCQ